MVAMTQSLTITLVKNPLTQLQRLNQGATSKSRGAKLQRLNQGVPFTVPRGAAG